MLYIIATPIGNLADISDRAKEILKSVDYVVCEDPNHSRILLQRLDCHAKLIGLNAHSKSPKIDAVISILKSGSNAAYITDAGTPGISDPGGLLVRAAVENQLAVCPIPGPSAVTTALSVSGFNTDQFIFAGYIPKKKGRQTFWQKLATEKLTVVMLESPDRITKTIAEIVATMQLERNICVCRELTKQFEQIWWGQAAKLSQANIPARGEFVIVIEGQK